MKNYYEQTVGEIVELLIRIKDRNGIGSRDELEAINNACNILTKRFNRSTPANVLIYECITSIHWQEEDIKQTLEEEGFEPSDENVKIVLDNNLSLEKGLQETCCESGWEIINYAIVKCKDKLKSLKEE